MKVLVDEGVPVQVMSPLRLNRGHGFDDVDQVGWKGKKDQPLYIDAAARGYDAVLTLEATRDIRP